MTLPQRAGPSAPLAPPHTDTTAVQFGRAMVHTFGWFYWALGLGWALNRVRFEDHSVERIQKAQRAGPIVYVMLNPSRLDYVTLNTVLKRRRLPIADWSNGHATFIWQPVVEAWHDVFKRATRWLSGRRAPDPIRSGWLTHHVATHHVTVVFIGSGEPSRDTAPTLEALLEAQARLDRPIQLVPLICVWDASPEVENDSSRFLRGSRERPSMLTQVTNLYGPSNRPPFVQAGEPLDLAEFVRRTEQTDRASRLHRLLRRFLTRESRVVRGPTLVPYAVLKQTVLDNPPMKQFAEEEAKATGKATSEVTALISREYDKIAANFSWTLISFLSWAMTPVWRRMFSDYDIRDEDVERIRAAARQGAPVLVPCHKSHFDYLLLSWVCYYRDIIVPHVVAGINLSFWPVGIFLRAAGGFFVKRSFTNERIHPRVFSRYLRQLLFNGYTVEFFIEGGRTRTGLLLTPKLGVLGMVIDAAWLNKAARRSGDRGSIDQEVTLLPVAITYESVAEEGAYREELAGGAKKKESMGQLLQARSLLGRRFGKVYVRTGEPIPASAVIAQVEDWGALTEDERRGHLQVVGDLIVHRIGMVTVVLPTSLIALALLAHPRRGILHDDLMARVERLRSWMRRMSVLESASLDRTDAALANALDRFTSDGLIKWHLLDGKRVWHIVRERRISLDFHKNQVLHFFAPAAHAAAVIAAHGARRFTPDDLRPGWELLVDLLDREFTFDPLVTRDAVLDRALAALVAHQALARDGDGYVIADPARLDEILGLMRGLLESYLLVASAALRVGTPIIEAAGFLKDLSNQAEVWIDAGVVTRPEALNAVALKNALTNYSELGMLPSEVRGQHRVVRDRLESHTEWLKRATAVQPDAADLG